MNNLKKVSVFTTALLMSVLAVNPAAYAADTTSYDMGVTVNVGDKGKAISPYIFGINEHGLDEGLQVNSVRQGGNRFTAYNWETNYSSAGSDWKHSSDDYLSKSKEPADCVQTLSEEAKEGNIAYKLGTVQMAGYVAADKLGTVEEDEAAPGKRWNEVIASKGADLSLTPDLTDGKVYIDEYVNYVVNKIGDSTSETGIQGWSLDNEPGLWHHTHSRIHGEEVTAKELLDKSIATAKAVKSVDPKAEIFGPALFGYTAFVQLSAKDGSTDWKTINKDNQYRWFIEYYLEQMKKAEEETGTRLLDVMDVHYYSEAQCPDCGTRMCGNPEHTKGIDEMTQSYRTLIEKDYKENSWIGEWCQSNIPLLTNMKDSIDKYYPGTKLAVTEYDFGGGKSIAGAIAEVDALGTFADNGVYYATLWAEDVPYQYSAINLFTNYDGEGSAFGNTLIESKTGDYIKSTSYASIQDSDQGTVSVILTNKDQNKTENAQIEFKGANTTYKNAAVYILSGETNEIIHKLSTKDIKDNKLTVEIPPLAIAEVVVSDDEADYREVVSKTPVSYEYVDGKVTEGKEAGAFDYTFDEPIAGKTLVLDIEAKDTQSAMGCAADFNVKYDGKDYWISYNWAATSSGKVEVDLSKAPSGGSCVTDKTDVTDKALLAKLGEIAQQSTATKASFQTWYVADAAWEDSDHSKITLKGVQIKKEAEGPAAPVLKEYEGTVKADKKAGNYTIDFAENLDGGKIVLDITTDGTPLANGCLDTNVELDGVPYWVHYSWEAKSSGKVEVDLMKPAGALDTSDPANEESTKDKAILAAAAEKIKEKTSLTFQTWYVADANWDDDDHGKVTLNGAVLVKESASSPALTPDTYRNGDVNGDGKIDITDLTNLSLYLIGDMQLSEASLKAADVDKDGSVLLADLAKIRQYISKVNGVTLD